MKEKKFELQMFDTKEPKCFNISSSDLIRSAKNVAKEVMHHFKTDGWDLGYSALLDQVFFDATGESLETFLMYELQDLLPKNKQLVFGFKEFGMCIGYKDLKTKKKVTPKKKKVVAKKKTAKKRK